MFSMINWLFRKTNLKFFGSNIVQFQNIDGFLNILVGDCMIHISYKVDSGKIKVTLRNAYGITQTIEVDNNGN